MRLKTIKSYSFAAVLCFLFSVCACAPSSKNHTKDKDVPSFAQTALLLRRYPAVPNRWSQQYANSLAERLLMAVPKQMEPVDQIEVVLLNSPQPLAYSGEGDLILLSSGLVLALGTEAEFAFVIAHELAHKYLGHTTDAPSPKKDPLGTYQKEQELAADRFAAGLIALAGYDPRAGIVTIVRTYQAAGLSGKSKSHPEWQNRAATLEEYLTNSNWTPPGIINTRDFTKLRVLLKESA